MNNRNRFHITDTETFNETGEILIDHPEFIASMARTHIIDIELTNIPEYRNRRASTIRINVPHLQRLPSLIGVEKDGQHPPNSSIVVRPLTRIHRRLNRQTTGITSPGPSAGRPCRQSLRTA